MNQLMPKQKTCIICGKNHQNSLMKTCSPLCARKHTSNLKKLKEDKIKVKKEKLKIKKAFTRSTLIKEADRVASLYVRERDRWNPCITCWSEWNETHQNWHFMSRRHLNTRWYEKNMNGQCTKCNCWWAWEQYLHSLAIDRLYWSWTSEQIMKLANDTSKTTDEEILMHIKYYYWELDRMIIDYKPKKIYLTN